MAKKRFVTIGQKVQFDPFEPDRCYGINELRETVSGTIIEINKDHMWFSVEYGNPKQRTSFNFCDIGKTVMLVG